MWPRSGRASRGRFLSLSRPARTPLRVAEGHLLDPTRADWIRMQLPWEDRNSWPLTQSHHTSSPLDPATFKALGSGEGGWSETCYELVTLFCETGRIRVLIFCGLEDLPTLSLSCLILDGPRQFEWMGSRPIGQSRARIDTCANLDSGSDLLRVAPPRGFLHSRAVKSKSSSPAPAGWRCPPLLRQGSAGLWA